MRVNDGVNLCNCLHPACGAVLPAGVRWLDSPSHALATGMSEHVTAGATACDPPRGCDNGWQEHHHGRSVPHTEVRAARSHAGEAWARAAYQPSLATPTEETRVSLLEASAMTPPTHSARWDTAKPLTVMP